jgi:hypothetical protein
LVEQEGGPNLTRFLEEMAVSSLFAVAGLVARLATADADAAGDGKAVYMQYSVSCRLAPLRRHANACVNAPDDRSFLHSVSNTLETRGTALAEVFGGYQSVELLAPQVRIAI